MERTFRGPPSRPHTQLRQLSAKKQRIVDRILRLHKLDEPLNITAVKRRHPELMRAVYEIKPFWGWKQAIEDAGLDYKDIRIQLLDFITCKECGKRFAALATHIIAKHDMSPDEYRVEHPNAELSCETLRASLLGRRHPRKKRKNKVRLVMGYWERLWTSEYVLDRVWEFQRRGLPVNYCSIVSLESPLAAAARHHFGSWYEMIRQLGLDPEAIRLSAPPRPREHGLLIRAIQARQQAGLPLNTVALQKGPDRDVGLFKTARSVFGTWRKALQATGLCWDDITTTRGPAYATKSDVLQGIKNRRRSELPLNMKAVCRQGSQLDIMLYVTACRLFGSWRRAIESAGLQYEEIALHPIRFPTKEAVLRSIMLRKKQKLSLNPGSVARGANSDNGLLKAAKKMFGSWRKAIEASGLRYEKVRLRRSRQRWTKELVVTEIRRRRRKGLPLSSLAIQKSACPYLRLYVVGREMFGSWKKAIEAAGLDYETIRKR